LWRCPKEGLITALPLGTDSYTAVPGIPNRVVILAFARCKCSIVNAWNCQKIRIPEDHGLANFWSTSEYDEVENLLPKEQLTFAQKWRAKWYPDDEKIKAVSKVLQCQLF
jgi:hypothetical protein